MRRGGGWRELQEGRAAGGELLEGSSKLLVSYWCTDSCTGLLVIK